jgi:hypothetical protein
MKFVAVRQVSLMTHRECRVDHLYPIMCPVVGENQAPLHIQAPVNLFKLAFYHQIFSTPNHCHMDLWLA